MVLYRFIGLSERASPGSSEIIQEGIRRGSHTCSKLDINCLHAQTAWWSIDARSEKFSNGCPSTQTEPTRTHGTISGCFIKPMSARCTSRSLNVSKLLYFSKNPHQLNPLGKQLCLLYL